MERESRDPRGMPTTNPGSAPRVSSPLAQFVRRARDPARNRADALVWHSLGTSSADGDRQTRFSYARLYREAARASTRLWSLVMTPDPGREPPPRTVSPPPKLTPLQTEEEHRARVICVAVPEGAGLVVAALAAAMCGFAFAPVSETDPPLRIARCLRDAKCSLVVVDERYDEGALKRRVEEAAAGTVPEGRFRRGGAELEPETRRPPETEAKRFLETVRVVDLSEIWTARDASLDERNEDDDALTRTSPGMDSRELKESDPREESEPREVIDAFVDSAADLDLEGFTERHPDRVSHVFFTSGSTGTPKGCVCTRGGLAWFVKGKNEKHEADATSTTFLASPHVFDPSFGDIYASLSIGGRIALCPKAYALADLGRCLAVSRATHLTTTPTALGSIVPPKNRNDANREPFLPFLRVVALGGEPIPRALAETWVQLVPLLANTYGVTECCVYQTFSVIHKTRVDATRRDVGDAMSEGVRALFAPTPEGTRSGRAGRGDDADDDADADADAGAAAPRGRDLSEIWLAGPQVGLGYAGDARWTEERFSVRPRATAGLEERVFRTGDFAERIREEVQDPPNAGSGVPDVSPRRGGVERCVLVGRGDGQVKIRGRRVELGEIESAIRETCVCVAKDVVVTASGKGADGNSDGYLVAWMIPAKGKEDEDEDEGEDEDEDEDETCVSATTHDTVRWLLASRLPPHMLPSRCRFVREFPKTASGKTDLAALARRPVPPPPDRRRLDASLEKTKRVSELERRFESLVHAIWASELGVPETIVTPSSRFAELGGDSMVAVRVCKLARAGLVALAGCSTETNTKGNEEDFGAHGEHLAASLAPVCLTAETSLGTFAARVFADASAGAFSGVAAAAFASEVAAVPAGSDPTPDDAPRLASFSTLALMATETNGNRTSRASEGIALLYRAAGENLSAVARALVREGSVPVDGWLDADGFGSGESAGTFTRRTASSGGTGTGSGTGTGTGSGSVRTRANGNGRVVPCRLEKTFSRVGFLTPLHAACAAGSEAAALVLLDRGARPRARGRRGAAPLHLAVAAAKPFSTRGLGALLERADGTVREVPREDSKHEYRETGSRLKIPSRSRFSGAASALFALDDDAQSALHAAARRGTCGSSTIDWLLDTAEGLLSRSRGSSRDVLGSFLERRDVWGRTALHWASLNGHEAAVRALLRRGASPRAADADGETPITLAERRALCSARDRPDGERASRWGAVAAALGGSGTTKHLAKRK